MSSKVGDHQVSNNRVFDEPPGLNKNLDSMSEDRLYHLGYSTKDDLRGLFGDVKFVCMGGSAPRMEHFANLVRQELADMPGFKEVADKKPENICRSDRYVMYKVGPLLSVNHGMGFSSISILLHEVIKLLHYAGAYDAVIIRIGTSGGIGVDGGTVVVTDVPFNAELQLGHNAVVLGEVVHRPSVMDAALRDSLVASGADCSFAVIKGNTMSTDDFYEGRLDGAICQYTKADKLAFLQQAYDAGVRNIEMECIVLGAMCHATGIRGACVCVTLIDRLLGDQVNISQEEHSEFQLRPQRVVLAHIRQEILSSSAEPKAKRAK